MSRADVIPGSGDLAELLTVHLQDEEAVLAAALPSVRAMKAALTQTGADRFPDVAEQHHAILNLLADIKLRRQRFREMLARRLQCPAETLTITFLLSQLPAHSQETLGALVERIRRMANEFVALNRWLTVHLRIHLDAYHRLLCDLTGTAHSSGRYGRAGKAETGDLRPLLQIRG